MLPDMDALLAPIDPASPCGMDLSFSVEFDQLQEARREDDNSLAAGEWSREMKRADWPRVAEQTHQLLTTRSKDLRLAGWLAEALAKTQGFTGLAQGFEATRQLLANYWQDLHPRMEDGDLQERSGNLAWLYARSAELVREIPLVNSGQAAHGWNAFETARVLQLRMDRDPDHAEELARGHVTQAQLHSVQAATPQTFFAALLRDFATLRNAAEALEEVINAKLGEHGPSGSALRAAIEAVATVVERLAQQSGVVEPPRIENAAPATAAGSAQPSAPGVMSGAIQTRQQALQQLRVVAEFFRRTEPHSPVTYLAEKAANWGEMPLHSWLRQVVHDGGVLAQLEELLGTTPSPPAD